MQFIKTIVIGLGVLIVLGFVLLGYGFVKKANNPDWKLFSSGPAGAPEAPFESFKTIDLNLPEGCVITTVRPDSARAYLTIGGPAPCNRVIIVDTVRSRILGTIQP
jgi:hypothetical protein